MKDLEIIKKISKKLNKEVSFKKDKNNNVTSIEFNNYGLEQIPPEITMFKELRILYLSGNNIREIPREITSLKKLEVLHIQNNKIEEIPGEVKQLKSLQTLDLQNNPLKGIPSEILNLRNIRRLDLSACEIVEIPREIKYLKQLRSLELRKNNINFLPKELSELENLNRLHLRGNPIKNVPKSVLSKGTKAVLNYLENKKIKLWTSKMVIVGQGGVGKSCLFDALRNKNFNSEKESTHGMQIEEFILQHPIEKNVEMKLKVWDFGGQDIYHATHQFYLTNNSLFILVWSTRLGYKAGKLYYWLETIQALAPDSPVIIVSTHSEQRGADLPKKDITYRFPKIQFFEVDNKTGLGIKELHDGITQTASELDNMGIERPESWVRATDEIRNSDKNYISKKELFDIFFRVGIESSEKENPADYLHELGEILYYADEAKLRNTIIIKPQWLSSYIAKVLDSSELDRTAGFLKKSLMNKLWKDLTPSMRLKFIILMQKFDLAYKVDDPDTVCLVVEKLKHEEADFVDRWNNFDGYREITLVYDDMSALPAGIPTWFIARTYRFTTFTHWRLGALLMYNRDLEFDKKKQTDNRAQNLALIVAKPELKQILLKVKGSSPEFFSAILRDTLEYTLDRFEGLKKTIKIPCPGHAGNKCTHKFKLEHLQKRLQHKPSIDTIECPEGMEQVSVPKMMYGISTAPRGTDISERIINEMRHNFDLQAELIKKESKDIVETFKKEQLELIKFIELEFIKTYQVQQRMQDISCPNLFTLRTKEDKSLIEKLRLDIYYLELQLWCQFPGHQHPVGKPYQIKVARKWLKNIAPYFNRMMKFLKWTVPLINPALGKIFIEDIPMQDDIDFGKTLIKKIGDIKTDKFQISPDSEVQYVESREELLLISTLLNKYDKKKKWGGLIRKITPEGYILWVCKEHALEYEPAIRI